jgi:UDP-glucose 4-epimerase
LKSSLHGEHLIDGTEVGKPTVVNFFVNRVLVGETLTLCEPGTQARNFVHVNDVARAYVQSAERLLEQLERGETETETFEIASEEDMSVMRVSGIDVDVELVENPRSVETMVEDRGGCFQGNKAARVETQRECDGISTWIVV